MRQNKLEFSKILLIQESALLWITTLAYIFLAFYCIKHQYLGTLPWLTAGVSLPWVAYGTSQGFYYNKSKKENSKDGIKYELAVREAESLYNIPIQKEETTCKNAAEAVKTAMDLFGPI